ncbi:MAG: hypothetical protein LAT57_10080 [Balneolales bacterium]|nr:hypothetical protein [Balneolales bacterium]
MISIKNEGIVISITEHDFENDGVLNPAIMQEGNTVHMFYRAVRRGNYSTIGYAKLEGPLNVVERNEKPLIIPSADYEIHGVEDPRIVKIDDVYYLTYCAYDGVNALGCLATSTDLIHFEKQGIVVPQVTYEEFKEMTEFSSYLNEKYERFHVTNNILNNPGTRRLIWDKNLIFFPRKVNDKFMLLHRIKPDIQIVSFNTIEDLTKDFWKDYLLHFSDHILMASKHDHEIGYIGGGCPPIETEAGWLMIYHGVHDSAKGYIYTGCAALLDLEDPTKEIARLPYALFEPELPWELFGYVDNVVFPTGTSLFDGRLYVYYGAADKRIAAASVDMKELITELLQYKV